MLVARWVPVPDATVDAALAALDAVRAADLLPRRRRRRPSPTSTRRWSTPSPAVGWRRTTGARRCPSRRDPALSAARSVLRALADPDPAIGGGGLAHPDELAALAARASTATSGAERGEPVVVPRRPAGRARRPLRRLGGPPRARRRASTPAAGARPRTSGMHRRSPSRWPAGPITWPRLADAVTELALDAGRLRRDGGRAGHRPRAGRRSSSTSRRPSGSSSRRRPSWPGAASSSSAPSGWCGPASAVRGRATPTAGGDHGTAVRPRGRRRVAPRRRRRRRPGRAVRRRAGTGRAAPAPRCCTAAGAGCASTRPRCAGPAAGSRTTSATSPRSTP